MVARRLVRNTRSAVLGGVAAGFADYLDVDPVLTRLIFILLCIAGGSGVLLYLVCWLIMPRDDEAAGRVDVAPPADRFVEEVREAGDRVVDRFKRGTAGPARGRLLAGCVLILLGSLFLLDRFANVWWLDIWRLWPILLIAAGVFMLMRSRADDGAEVHPAAPPPAWTDAAGVAPGAGRTAAEAPPETSPAPAGPGAVQPDAGDDRGDLP